MARRWLQENEATGYNITFDILRVLISALVDGLASRVNANFEKGDD